MTNASASTTVVLVDDAESDRRLGLLLSGEHLDVTSIAPSSDAMSAAREVLTILAHASVGLALLDYRLDGSGDTTYRGGSLAATLRDLQPDVPLVLLTTESRLTEYVANRPSIHSLFDAQVLKEQISNADDPQVLAESLASLAIGHQTVHELLRGVADEGPATLASVVVTLVAGGGPSEVERNQIELVLDAETQDLKLDAPNDVARWIHQKLLAYPGPLLSAAESAAVLGVTLDSFDELVSVLEESQYDGIFAAYRPAWWYHKLTAIIGTGLADRPALLKERLGVTVLAAQCPWCGELEVSRACFICSRAVDDIHSVQLRLPQPDWAARAVVCFACIYEGRAMTHHSKFTPGAEDLVDAIVTGEMPANEGVMRQSQEPRERWQ